MELFGGSDVDCRSEVDEGLGRGVEQAAELERRARLLQAHFRQSHASMTEIGRLCQQADASIRQSQQLLNRSAHRMHELNERARRLCGASAHGQTEPAASSASSSRRSSFSAARAAPQAHRGARAQR
mmetsp:Transcript_16765/g.47854  ORF Transcript_16765/g.47854 Transcript_16765/m.47854 type:complete len:127 (+) Transcript_16765:51-431(+)